MFQNELFVGGQCQVRVVEHSKSEVTGKEIITFSLTYPRIIHAELMTHRMFSRNASSTRAIPTKKLIDRVRETPTFFVHVGANQPGMQAHAEVSDEIKAKFREEWNELANINADFAERWALEYGIHKQVTGRVLEPFSTISVLVTATEYDNWYELRDHADAQPEIRDLASTMRKAKDASTPRLVGSRVITDARAWHLPYVTLDERKSYPVTKLLAMSAARCARVSYLTHDNQNPALESDIALYHRLVESKPLHASPLEHQALCSHLSYPNKNFTGGWVQHRSFLETAGSIQELERRFELAGTPDAYLEELKRREASSEKDSENATD
jgi:thymidylate synthase ThyX